MSKRRDYKDTVFRMLFRDKENLLELYNAMNGTHYDDVSVLEITTLENAVYLNVKNDVSFVLGFDLNIYEHQSTVNPNIPLRDLVYVAKVLQGLVKDENIYSRTLIKIPTPRFVVFYNGMDKKEERWTRKLSDMYINQMNEPELELKVLVLNINYGSNLKLMEACRTLKEYSQFVAQVRKYAETEEFSEAVEHAVEKCIRNGILSEFLAKNRAEAIEMCILEFDEEKYINSEKEQSFQDGQKSGIEIGEKRGKEQGREQTKRIIVMNREGKSTALIAEAEGISEEEVEDILELI